MSSQPDYLPPSGQGWPPVLYERLAFADMYNAHAVYVFDYCHSLVGSRHRAAAATQATFIAAHSLVSHLTDRDRLRAWLMALARHECQDSPSERAVSEESAGRAGGELADALAFVDATDDDATDEGASDDGASDGPDEAGAQLAALALRRLSAEHRELLSLVYRYGIGRYELPAILMADAAGVAGLLTDAEERFAETLSQLTVMLADSDETETEVLTFEPGWASDLERRDGSAALAALADMPLIALPASVWRRASRAVLDPRFASYRDAVRSHADHLGPDGFPVPMRDPVSPSFRRLLGASAVLAALLLAPAGLGAAGYAEFGGLAASKVPHVSTGVTATAPAPGLGAASPDPSSPRSKAASSARSHATAHSTGAASGPVAGASSSQAGHPSPTHPSGGHSSSSSPVPTVSPPPSKSPTSTPTTSPTSTPASPTPTADSTSQSGSADPSASPAPSPSSDSSASASAAGGGPTPSAV